MGKKKRHHYIPRFYLNGFIDPANEPFVWVYQKGETGIIKTTAENIALEKHYYSFTTPSGDKDSETFENVLSEMEGKAAPVVQKIKNYETLDKDDRAIFAVFLAFMLTRVPNYRQNTAKMSVELFKKITKLTASTPELFDATIRTIEEDLGEKIDYPHEELREFLLEGNFDITPNPEQSLQHVNAELAPVFYEMNWIFLKSTDRFEFLTSDNPLVYFDPTHDPKSPYGVGLLNRNIEVTFPVTKDIAFSGSWRKQMSEGFLPSTHEMVRMINRRTVMSALRFVFASKKSSVLHGLVQKYKNSSAPAPKTFVRLSTERVGNAKA